ncbi:hypothetical protein Tco_1297442 [Tanacetum coccineum]
MTEENVHALYKEMREIHASINNDLKIHTSPEEIGKSIWSGITADAEAIVDVGISEGVVAHPEDGVGIRFEITASDIWDDDEEFEAEASAADTREIAVDPLAIGDSFEFSRGGIPDLKDTIYDIVHYMCNIGFVDCLV